MTDQPVLRIANPCHQDWNRMTPVGDAGRHCAVCDKVVIDVAGLPEQRQREALADLARRAATEHLCVRALSRDGEHLVAAQPAVSKLRLLTNGLAAMLAVAMAGCTGAAPVTGTPAVDEDEPTTTPPAKGCDVRYPQEIRGEVQAAPPREIMGDMALPSPPVKMGKVAAPEPIPSANQ